MLQIYKKTGIYSKETGKSFLPGAETQYPEAVFVMLFFQVGELPKSKSSFIRSSRTLGMADQPRRNTT